VKRMRSTSYHVFFFDDPDHGAWGVPVMDRWSDDFLIAEYAVRLILGASHEPGIFCASISAERKTKSEDLGIYYWNGEEVIEHTSAKPISREEALTLKRKRSRAIEGDEKTFN